MPALRPRRGSPGPSPRPSRKPKAGGPQRERPNPRNRTERKTETQKTETQSKRKEKQRQKQNKNKTGAKRKRKNKEAPITPRRRRPKLPYFTSALPKRAPPPPKFGRIRRPWAKVKPRQSKAKQSKAKPARVNRIDARAEKKRRRPWIRPLTPSAPKRRQAAAQENCAPQFKSSF